MLTELIAQGENVELEELNRSFQEAGLVHFDIAPVERTDRTSLDDAKLHQYFETYYQLDYVRLEAVLKVSVAGALSERQKECQSLL